MCNCDNSTSMSGIDGYNAFTITTADFIQPAVNTNVTISVSNSGQYTGKWAATGQTIFIDNAGYFIVVGATSTSLTIKYESDYASYNQSLTASGDTVTKNKKVSPAGKKGGDGINGTSLIYAYNNLTGVSNSAATGESTLASYTVPATTLGNAGDEIDVDVYYRYYNNDRVVIRIKFGGSTIYSYEEIGSVDTNNYLNIKISKISNTSELWTITKQTSDGSKLYLRGFVDEASSTADTSIDNLIEITADNIVFGSNQLILKKFTIKKYSAA